MDGSRAHRLGCPFCLSLRTASRTRPCAGPWALAACPSPGQFPPGGAAAGTWLSSTCSRSSRRRIRALAFLFRVGRHVALSRWWRQGRLSRVPPSDTLAFTHYFRAGKQVALVGVWEGKAGSRQGRAAAWVPRERRSSPRARTALALAWRTPQEPSARPIGAAAGTPGPGTHRGGGERRECRGRVNAQLSEVTVNLLRDTDHVRGAEAEPAPGSPPRRRGVPGEAPRKPADDLPG